MSAVIWTTTPWSLVGNQAVCYAEGLKYSAVRASGRLLIIASALVEDFKVKTGIACEEVFTFDGGDLADATYNHPLKPKMPLPFLVGSHVSAEKGTGLVHTAPAHGPEDYLVAIKHNIKVDCHVDEEGCFTNLSDELNLNGQLALQEGQASVLEALGSRVLCSGPFYHAYPLDWRTKQPLIVRASSQWFINTEGLRDKAMAALEGVNILPEASSTQYRAGMSAMVSGRPYWCISRQRVWGTPIPVVFLGEKPLLSSELVENVCQMIDKFGPNSWWQSEPHEFVPESLLKQHGTTADKLVKGKDIMDIWLDSGLSWSSVLEDIPADLYLEGVDQFTGWFQSSLLTSVALKDKAPYKTLFVHGFVVDDKGRKMSKSVGNVVDPKSITLGGKDQQKNPAYGVDTLRWWVASHSTQHSQVILSNKIIADSSAEVSRLRLLLKFILGAISDLQQPIVEQQHHFGYLDAYMLHLLHEFHIQMKQNYQTMRYNKVCSDILNFNANQISGLYCHVVKDRLYCMDRDSSQRRECQVVLNRILICLCQSLAPVLPHLVEEVWSHHPLNVDKKSFFKSTHEEPKPIWNRPFVEHLMDSVLDVKKEIIKQLVGKNTLEYGCKIRANPEFFDRLMLMQETEVSDEGELCEILQVSEVVLEEGKAFEDQWVLEIRPLDKSLCGRCRRYTSDDASLPCKRCQTVMEEMDH